ncbi:MAG: hypothetical protein HGB10_05985 [Coriobacteriia bacterium]|nr:hypothetical protein [Coriobacteriia bacterium]
MSLILVAVLVIGGLVGAAAIVVGVPAVLGLIAFDAVSTRKDSRDASPATATPNMERVSIERGFARAFVIAGGAFWAIAIFAGMYTFRRVDVVYAVLAAFFPLVAVLVTLVVGWYYERVAAAMLTAASLAVVAWGVIYQFEIGVWMLVTLALIGPMLTAASLFWAARREQDAFELALSRRPELAAISSRKSDAL